MNDFLLSLDKELSGIEKGDEDVLSLQDARRFNILEWYSFLVNEKQITDKKMQKYFEELIINNFEKHFLEDASDQEKMTQNNTVNLRNIQ